MDYKVLCMVQTTVHLDEDQKKRLDNLPRNFSFSQLVREHFDYMMYDIENKYKLDLKAV